MIAKILTSLNMKSDLQGLFTISNELILEFRKDFLKFDNSFQK